MKYRGHSRPWPIVTVEVTTFDLERIAEALEEKPSKKSPGDPSYARIAEDVRNILRRMETAAR